MPKPSLTGLVEARILPEQRWKHGRRHEILDRAVSEGCSVALSVTGGPLSKARFTVFGLTDAGEKTVPGEFDIVERGPGHNLEFLPRGERRDLAGVFYCQKVRQSIKQPILRCASGRVLRFVLIVAGHLWRLRWVLGAPPVGCVGS